ncbi:MAG: hypothetical protein KC877_00205 [Candidatus Kaiserbacteria bacterium]|nr:hypothetical protein [Candidatus Kaiserbacteria bacterium]MCB9815855.1 hypothetical protein [Candidatus Nomurabacteria bacterium]
MKKLVILILIIIGFAVVANTTSEPTQVVVVADAQNPFTREEMDTTPVSSDMSASATILDTLADLSFKPTFMSGQHVGHATDDLTTKFEHNITKLHNETGLYPKIFDLGYGFGSVKEDLHDINTIAVDHWNRDGLVTINFTPNNPFTNNGLYDSSSSDFADIFTPDTEPYTRWRDDLRKVADGLEELEAAGVVVLIRPLHEMNGDWFWWSWENGQPISSETFQKLWQGIFEYFTNERGLNNLIWVYSPNSTYGSQYRPVLELYPGDDLVDILAVDYYRDDLSELNQTGDLDELISKQKPIGLAEIGSLSISGFNNQTIATDIQQHFPAVSFAVHWSSYPIFFGLTQKDRSIIDNDEATAYMQNEGVVTVTK